MEHEDRRIPNPISSSSAPRKFLLEHRHSSSRRTRRKRRAAIFEETLLPSPTERRKRKTGWKGKREKDPGILWTGFSDLCLRPRLLFVFLLPAARREEGMEKGRMRRLEQKVFFPHCSRHPGIHTYVEFRCTRISRVNLTPGEKKNFLLPLFFQQRSCSLSPVLSPPSIPLSGSARPSIHTIFTLAFVRLLAFSRPFRRPIRAAQKKGGEREGSFFGHERF